MADAGGRIYLFWGDDALSRDEVVRSFKTRMLARAGGELNLAEFHAPDLTARALIATCDTIPFLADRRLVIVHGLFGWKPRAGARRRAGADGEAKGESSNPLKAEREAFLGYLPDIAPHATLLLVEPSLTPPQREEITRQVPRSRLDVRAFPAPQGAELERWLAKRARQHGGELGPRVATLLREHGPRSLEGLDQEVAKLVTYAGPVPVTVDALDELLSGGEIIIFELLDALADGRAAQALTSLRQLYQQGQRPEALAPQIIALYRRLLVCRLAMAERVDPAEIQRIHGVKLIDKLRNQARRLPAEQLERALEILLDFDRKLKRSELEPEPALEVVVAQLVSLSQADPSTRPLSR
jgi:DNA polymerase III subunit delta